MTSRFLKALFLLVVITTTATRCFAVTPEEADAAFDAFNKTFWDAKEKVVRKDLRGETKADFWFTAQIWDVVMDQYDRTGDPQVKQQIDDLYDGFVRDNPDWTKNKFNDDIMWWSIACTRAYKITSNERYLTKAKESFDFVYDNFLDDKYGGGLYWINERTSKNTCLNAPAVIAAVRLSVLLKDPSYLEKAKSLFAWQKKTLTDGTGKIFDSIGRDKAGNDNHVAKFSLTYNQGTYIGAAVLLYQQTNDQTYLEDAIKTAQWTKDHLCRTDERILQPEGSGDGGAFKGIFVRYMKLLIEECNREEFRPWMVTNANAAWKNKRGNLYLFGEDWSQPAGRRIQSHTSASGLAVVLCFTEATPSP
jgi:predicted alpha-1,6-mannanase (GH76 family)